MPPLREIRGHMRAVAGIAQVIHAMESVSLVTAHRLQDRVAQSKAYAQTSWRVLERVARALDPELHRLPVFDTSRTGGSTCLILVSSNRGMAGGHDQNILRAALAYLHDAGEPPEVLTIGSQGHSAVLRRGLTVAADWSQLDEHLTMDDVAPIAGYVLRSFGEGRCGRVAIAYAEYREGSHGRPTVRQLLPLQLPGAGEPRQFIFEPDPVALIEALVPRVIHAQIHQGILESFTAENAARAVAMRSAGTNAHELADHLRLSYNKSRQEAITAEMSEVVSSLALQAGS